LLSVEVPDVSDLLSVLDGVVEGDVVGVVVFVSLGVVDEFDEILPVVEVGVVG